MASEMPKLNGQVRFERFDMVKLPILMIRLRALRNKAKSGEKDHYLLPCIDNPRQLAYARAIEHYVKGFDMEHVRYRILVGFLMFGAFSAAIGDGCALLSKSDVDVVGKAGSTVTSPRQECLLATDGKMVRVVLRTHFETPSDELAWIVPVPAKPRDIDKIDPELFAELDKATAPTFYTLVDQPGPIGCGCAQYAVHEPSKASRNGSSVMVYEQGTAGIFEYVVLGSTNGDELSKWLNTNGYALPIGSERILTRYVDNGWYWLAMKLRKNLPDSNKIIPHPVTYTYDAEMLTYPLVISQISASLENEIVLYVLGSTRYAPANWSNSSLNDLIYKPYKPTEEKEDFTRADTPSGTTYEHFFENATKSKDGQIFITESAQTLAKMALTGNRDEVELQESIHQLLQDFMSTTDNLYLTRLRTVMPPKAMNRDVILVPVEWPEIDNRVYISSVMTRQGSEMALAGCGVSMLLLCLWPQRRKLPRFLRVICGVLVCTILCML
jgi:hypothetical protein